MNTPRTPTLARRAFLAIATALLATSAAQAAIPATQRQYLLDFHAATGGPGWTNQAGWGGAPGTECTWHGVYCAGDTVTRLELSSNNLTSPMGVPLPDWSALPDLTEIGLSNNALAGPVPPIAGLAQLEIFAVSQNQLTGPLPSPAGLLKLERYHALINQFSGPIPALGSLPALKSFLVRDNQLTGTIPALTGAPAMEWFSVQKNQLTGGIPALPPALERLAVDQNQLTGPVPAAPATLTLPPNGSLLCPNHLTPSASPAWDAATGDTPWHATCTPAPPGLGPTAIPTLGEWALALLSLAAAALGFAALRRKQV